MKRDLNVMARRVLSRNNFQFEPDMTDEQVRAAAFERFKDEDFISAHEFRLNKERPEWTKEDWKSILEISGVEKVANNMAGLMACLSHDLITRDQISV